jgi:hypothetical protein
MPSLDLDPLEIDLASFAELRDGFGESWSSACLLGHNLLVVTLTLEGIASLVDCWSVCTVHGQKGETHIRKQLHWCTACVSQVSVNSHTRLTSSQTTTSLGLSEFRTIWYCSVSGSLVCTFSKILSTTYRQIGMAGNCLLDNSSSILPSLAETIAHCNHKSLSNLPNELPTM